MSASGKKTWNPTRYQHLYRHKSGTYYARISIGGKKTWRSLRTKLLSVAREELSKVLEREGLRTAIASEIGRSGTMMIDDAIKIRREEYQNDPSIKRRTQEYWDEIYASLIKSWPGLGGIDVSKITKSECEQWAGRFSKEISGTRFNNTLSALRRLFEIGIDHGVRFTNPAGKIKRVKPSQKDLTSRLPSRKEFRAWVATIRNAGGRFSRPCADLVEFLAYSGMRVGEARWVTWRHCDFDKGEVLVVGHPEEGTKNGSVRRVPMTRSLNDLLTRMKRDYPIQSDESPVLLVKEAQKAMDRAASKTGMERITHHDLRHLFATTCIESGVDIPTVAKWLGHKDGGALALKVYGHLRDEHSFAAAKRVEF